MQDETIIIYLIIVRLRYVLKPSIDYFKRFKVTDTGSNKMKYVRYNTESGNSSNDF